MISIYHRGYLVIPVSHQKIDGGYRKGRQVINTLSVATGEYAALYAIQSISASSRRCVLHVLTDSPQTVDASHEQTIQRCKDGESKDTMFQSLMYHVCAILHVA